jgi:hypothetical protein
VLTVFLLGLPFILSLFGAPYDQAWMLFVILLGAQWLNGVGRAATRYIITHWEINRGQWMLEVSSVTAVLICALGVGRYGPMAAAVAILTGALLVNTLITVQMLKETGRGPA